MEQIEEAKLKEIRGGGVSVLAAIGIAAAVVFLTGIIDGIVHPKKCTG